MGSAVFQINVSSLQLLIAVVAFVAPAILVLWQAGRAWERIGGQISTGVVEQANAATLHQAELKGVNTRLDALNGSTAHNRDRTDSLTERMASMEGREAVHSHTHTPVSPPILPT